MFVLVFGEVFEVFLFCKFWGFFFKEHIKENKHRMAKRTHFQLVIPDYLLKYQTELSIVKYLLV